jgi:fumarate reductase flavoprotein subunit
MKTRARIGLWVAVAALVTGLAAGAWAAGEGPLGKRHEAAGIACAGCHKETPPSAQVPMEACTACHGAYSALAAKTAKKHPNPHESHQGELPCESCHHAHRPSVDYCAQCHDFGFKP